VPLVSRTPCVASHRTDPCPFCSHRYSCRGSKLRKPRTAALSHVRLWFAEKGLRPREALRGRTKAWLRRARLSASSSCRGSRSAGCPAPR